MEETNLAVLADLQRQVKEMKADQQLMLIAIENLAGPLRELIEAARGDDTDETKSTI